MSNRSSSRWSARAGAALAVLALALAACQADPADTATPGGDISPAATATGGDSPDQTAEASPDATNGESPAADDDESAEAGTVSVDAILEEPDSYLDEEVEVVANVEVVHVEDRAFELKADLAEDTILVVVSGDGDFTVVEDRVVRVQGTLHELDDDALQDTDVTSDDVGEYEGEYVIVANSVGSPLD